MSTTMKRTQLNVRVRETVSQQLKVVADVEGSSLSDVAERAFTQYIEERKQDAEWQEQHKQWADKQRALLKAMRP